jgi:hypothetical protein
MADQQARVTNISARISSGDPTTGSDKRIWRSRFFLFCRREFVHLRG